MHFLVNLLFYSAPLEGGWGVKLTLNPKSFFFGWVVGQRYIDRCIESFPPRCLCFMRGGKQNVHALNPNP